MNRPFTERGGIVRSLKRVENGREEHVEKQSVGRNYLECRRGAFLGKCSVQRVK